MTNLPFSYVPAFNGDELSMIIGTCLPEGVVLVDREQGTVVAANERFLKLVGLESDGLNSGFSCERLVHPHDRSVFHTWKDATAERSSDAADESFEVRLLDPAGNETPVSVVLRPFRWKQRDYLIGFVTDISRQQADEERFRREIQEQKHRALEAIKSSLCVYQFNEKIKSTPVLTTRLLDVENEEGLFKEAAAVLTSEQGLNYRDVTFLLLEGNTLEVAFSTRELQETSFPLKEDNRYSRFIRKNFKVSKPDDGDTLVPLETGGRLIGICEIVSYSRERFFFDESGKVGEWQKDMLLTIGDIIALLLDNLRLAREIEHRSNTDPLTGTYNRHYFVGRLSSEIQRSTRYSRPISMLFMDVDKFKQVNDTYGHLVGDQVLVDLGALFMESLRTTDVVCRYGGDEFIALLPETDEEMAREAAEKLLQAVRTYELENPSDPTRQVNVSVSVGVSTLQPGENEEDFLKGADEALYRAKQGGRDCLVTVEARAHS